MDNLVGLRLEDALEKLKGSCMIKLVALESPGKKYDNFRVVRQKIITGESGECIEITYAGFPVLNDEL